MASLGDDRPIAIGSLDRVPDGSNTWRLVIAIADIGQAPEAEM